MSSAGADMNASPMQRGKRLVGAYLQTTSNLWAENRLLRFVAFASFLASIVLAFMVATEARKTRTIVVPFAASTPDLLVVGNEPSHEYLAAIARNVVSLTGTFTASSAEYQFNEVLKFVHPSAYDQLRKEWRDLATRLGDYREVSFATYVRPEIPIEIFADRMLVPTKRTRFVGSRVASEDGIVEIGYRVENGRFWILSVSFREFGSGGKDNASED